MRYYFFRPSLTRFLAWFLLAAALAGCSEYIPADTAPAAIAPATPASLALGTSANWIPTDNSTTATLTATLVDSSNAVMPGIPVSFSTNTGNLTASTATTDANGQATVQLRSGLADFTNRTALVEATVAGVTPKQIPILIKGSTVALTLAPSNTIQDGAGTLSATATATNAAGLGLSGMDINFSISPSGIATLSAATLTTDATGTTPALTITPVPATPGGTAVLTASFVNSDGSAPIPSTKDIIVTPATGLAFAITTPASSPTALMTAATQPLAATVPTTISGVTVTDVRISASSGTLTGTNPATGPLTSIRQTPAASAIAATYTAPGSAGSVTVQVDALGTVAGVPLQTLASQSHTIVISAPSTAAAQVLMSPSVSTIVPSSGANISTTTLNVTVRDSANNAVGGAAVLFGLLGTTGSGESVSPAVVYTDSFGQASTTFSAGTSPTLAAIYAQASIVGETCAFSPSPLTAETNALCDSSPIMVSSTAVSVTVGFGTTIADTANTTQYKLPGSVLVVNSNGSPVAGVPVTLSVFPVGYRNGMILAEPVYNNGVTTAVWECTGPYNTVTYRFPYWSGTTGISAWVTSPETSFTAAEDINRNGILDDGIVNPSAAAEETVGNGLLDTWGANEDTNLNGVLDTEDTNRNGVLNLGEDANGNGVLDTEDVNNNGILDLNTEDLNLNGILDLGEDIPLNPTARSAQAISGNGLLSPPQAAGGTVPLTVTTDSNGAATFDLQYPKTSAWFILDEVTARVIVAGTESTARTTLVLPMSEFDRNDPNCLIGHIGSY